MDHDQRFKVLLHEFLREFFLLFFSLWANRFDFDHVDWFEQEIFPDPPQGDMWRIDLVAKLPVLKPVQLPGANSEKSTIALIHIEVESRESIIAMRRRVFEYHDFLERKYQLPVLPIVLFLKVGRDGIGWDSYERHFWEECLMVFRYPYIGLPALDAETYLHGENVLGVALSTLMKIPPKQRLEFGLEAWRRSIQCQESPYRRFLLCELVNAYLPGDEQEREAFQQQLASEKNEEVREMTVTMFDKLREEGRQEGRQEGRVEGMQFMLGGLLERKFGSLSEAAQEWIASLTEEELREKGHAIQSANSLQDLGFEE